jgi:hypothetical protein
VDHFHLYALQAAAWQPAWACCGAAAGWELNCSDHLCALLAAVWRLALTCCWTTQSIPPSHITTAHPLNCSHSYHNSTRTHLLTHSSFGLEPGPDSDRATPKIPAAQPELHTSPHPLTTSPQGAQAPCGDPRSVLRGRLHRANLHAALARPPPYPLHPG